MSRIDLSTQELFLRLGSTPRSRSARADKLFRRLRSDEEEKIAGALTRAPARVAIAEGKSEPAKRKKSRAPKAPSK